MPRIIKTVCTLCRTSLCFCFFFSSRRRHTRYWRDWSSDVCSSDLWSPSTLTVNSRVIGKGWVIDADQVSVLPSTLPEMSCAPCRPSILPEKESPLVVIDSVPSCTPIGELIVVFQLPSADIASLPFLLDANPNQ